MLIERCCEHCGQTFACKNIGTNLRRFCDGCLLVRQRECNRRVYQRRRGALPNCLDCGVQTHHGRCKRCRECAKKYVLAYMQERHNHTYVPSPPIEDGTCIDCGESFQRKHKSRVRCDSCGKGRELALKRKRERGKKRVRSPEAYARWQQKVREWQAKNRPVTGKRQSMRVAASYRKAIKRGYRLGLSTSLRLLKVACPVVAVCKWCSASYVVHRNKATCSKQCSSAYARAQKHAEKASRRAKQAAGAEVDPIAVFTRDGWMCQACGSDTPQELRGTYEDDAPEVDHIVPLAAGGEHSMVNVQCLCRCCNILKGSMSMDEFVENWIGNKGLGGASSPVIFRAKTAAPWSSSNIPSNGP